MAVSSVLSQWLHIDRSSVNICWTNKSTNDFWHIPSCLSFYPSFYPNSSNESILNFLGSRCTFFHIFVMCLTVDGVWERKSVQFFPVHCWALYSNNITMSTLIIPCPSQNPLVPSKWLNYLPSLKTSLLSGFPFGSKEFIKIEWRAYSLPLLNHQLWSKQRWR